MGECALVSTPAWRMRQSDINRLVGKARVERGGAKELLFSALATSVILSLS